MEIAAHPRRERRAKVPEPPADTIPSTPVMDEEGEMEIEEGFEPASEDMRSRGPSGPNETEPTLVLYWFSFVRFLFLCRSFFLVVT